MALALAAACGMICACEPARGQQTDAQEASAGAATPPAARVAPGQMPTMPQAVSRPEGWPTAKSGRGGGQGAAKDNHVLSSILPHPGVALSSLEAAETPGDAVGGPSGAVVPAGFEEPAAPSAGGEARTLVVRSLDNARVVARVGPEVVLEGDLLTPTALAWLEKNAATLTPEQVRELRTQICRQLIKQHVESLIVYVDACRTIPDDRLPEIEKKVNDAFDQQQLPRLVKEAGVANGIEYDQLLRSRGQSLDRIRKTFFERALAQQWIQQKVMDDGEIPHAEMIAWYQNHLAEYDYPARARFEQMTVKFGAARPRAQAWNMLAAMGNEVLQGKPFGEVARASSEGPTAASGGAFEWTTKGSLVSKVVDEAVFTLPIGQLSAILEDGGALHIVRVVERTEAGRTPFIEAQVEIREKLQEERRKRTMDDYLTAVRARTPVWTIFDDEPGGIAGQPAEQTAGRPRTTR